MGINSLNDFMIHMSGGASIMLNAKITGSCLCESVKYTLIGCPTMRIVCHCRNCQKTSGSSFMANSFFKKEHLTIEEGTEHIRTYVDSKTRSEATLKRQFCQNCGSALFATNESNPEFKDIICVTTGTMDVDHQYFEMTEWRPDAENFVENKRAWLPHDLVRAKK